jgi:uncharacterized protein (TIGR00369 family)
MSDNGWGAPRTRELTWYDPAIPAAAAAELPGREFLQALVDGRLPPPPIISLLGAELVSVGEGEALFRIIPDETAYNPIGLVHGGLLCTMLDSAAGCAVQTLLPAGVGYSSIEIKVSFLKALRAGDGALEIRGRALRVGRRVAFAEAHAHNASGELVGHATTSLAVVDSSPTARARAGSAS